MSRRKRTPDYTEQVADLLDRAGDLPEGPSKVAIFEEAVALADLHRDTELGYDTRMEMLWPAYHATRQDLVLVHFAWCLAKLDADPDLDAHEALWAYRWVLDAMPGFPDIPRAQIGAAIDDMARRYRDHGASLRPCYVLQRRVYPGLGDRPAALAAHRNIAKAKRDWLSDDPETEAAFAVFFAVFRDEYAKAVRLGEKLLADPDVSTHFRGLIMTELLLPLVRLKRWEQAADYQKRSLPMLKRERQGAANFAMHAEYLCIVGNLAVAAKVFEGHLTEAATEANRIMTFEYYRAGKFLCERLRATGKTKVKLRVPDALKIPDAEQGRVGVETLAAWLDARLAELVRGFDTRNGTTHFAEELAGLNDSAALADRYSKTANRTARRSS